MVNKLFWHISDFVLASYTFGCVKMSDFVLNNRHLWEVLIFFFHSKKTVDVRPRGVRPKTFEDADVIYYELLKPNETITGERYRTQLMRLSRELLEKGHNTSRGTKKWFYSMTTLGLTLPNPLKPTWKRSYGKSYPTCRIRQILRLPIIPCSGRWQMVWLISNSDYMKTWKNGLIRG